MNARRLIGPALAAAATLAVGCKSQPASPSTSKNDNSAPQVSVQYDAKPTVHKTDIDVPDESTAPPPETLAQKTTAYAQSMDPAPPAPSAPSAPSATKKSQPSSVQWDQPRSHANPDAAAPVIDTPKTQAIAPTAPPPAPQAQVSIASATSPPADSGHAAIVARSIKNSALNDVPAILPESADFTRSENPVTTDSLEQRLAQRVHDNPHDVASELDYELYGLLKDEPTPQLASISALPNEDRDLVAAVVDGISNFRTAVRQDNNMLLSKKIKPILEMADRARSEADLSVPTVAMCKRVDGFGRYDPVEARFPAGRENPTIVYCEIENFDSRLNDQHMWETNLTQEVTMFTETGMLVWKDKSRPVTDQCRNRRHDFFMYDLIKLPANLSIGRYVLKVSVADRTANRVAEATVPVAIVAE